MAQASSGKSGNSSIALRSRHRPSRGSNKQRHGRPGEVRGSASGGAELAEPPPPRACAVPAPSSYAGDRCAIGSSAVNRAPWREDSEAAATVWPRKPMMRRAAGRRRAGGPATALCVSRFGSTATTVSPPRRSGREPDASSRQEHCCRRSARRATPLQRGRAFGPRFAR